MLSTRGSQWAKVSYAHGVQDLYHPEKNPQGLVSMDNAENWQMQADLTRFIRGIVSCYPFVEQEEKANVYFENFNEACWTYGEGYTGTLRLRKAMASHLNEHFQPHVEFDAEEITFAAGVTNINEACALVTCNPDANETIMLGAPVYGAFSRDLQMRTGIDLEYVSVGNAEQFLPTCVDIYEAGYEAAKERGRNIRALMICNPHNPLGQCYPRETLEALLKFCARKGIHLISDEIYALSVYPRVDRPSETFTSVRALDFEGLIDPRQVHVLYGMSKDLGAAGLRLGCIISQNREFTDAVRSVCRFSSPSQFSMEIATTILENQGYVRAFLQKSHSKLLRNRLIAESMLTGAGIPFHSPGNAGFFIWIDLSAFLPGEKKTGEEGWAAQNLLSERLTQAGVSMSSGGTYRAPKPGMFRVIFSVELESLREGIRRLSRVILSTT